MQKQIAENSQHILLCAGFLNFDPIPPSVLAQVIQDFPNYENVLPSITSNKTAFNKLKDELNGYKTPVGRLITNRGKTDDLAKWTCFQETLSDAFSILHATTNTEGHEADPEGVIGLSNISHNVLISTSANLMCKKYNIDPLQIFEKHRGIIDGLSLRRAFAKFESALNVKAIKMNNGTLLIHPSLKEYVDGYIQALRKLGVSEKYVSAWNIFANADFTALKNAYQDHAVAHLKTLEARLLANENTREATLKNEQQELQDLLKIVDEYQISDTIIKEFARLNKMLDENVAKLKEKQEQAKPKSKRNATKQSTESTKNTNVEIAITPFIFDGICEISLKGDNPKNLRNVYYMEYQPKSKLLEYRTTLGEFFLELDSYSSLEIKEIKSADQENGDEEVQIVDLHTGAITKGKTFEDEASNEYSEDVDLPIESTENSFEFYEADDELPIVLNAVNQSENLNDPSSDGETLDDFFGQHTEIPTSKTQESPALANTNINLKDVQKWVLERARDGREAKYDDAIAIYGQKLVDQAITENYVFNYRGFLEEA